MDNRVNEYIDTVKNKPEDAILRETVEENEDLKRQIVLFQQQLVEKERRIEMLKFLLLRKSNYASTGGEVNEHVNSATQVGEY